MTDLVPPTDDHEWSDEDQDRNLLRMALIALAFAVATIFALIVVGAFVLGVGSDSDEESVDVIAATTTSVTEPESTTVTTAASDTSETTVTTAATETTTAPETTAATETTTAPETTLAPALAWNCSAAGMTAPEAQPELPDAAAVTRAAIIDAAIACDDARLGALMSPDFLSSFGGGDAIELWRDQEANGLRPMEALVRLLSLSPTSITTDDGPEDASGPHTYFVWPPASAYYTWQETPQADRDAVSTFHSAEDMAAFEANDVYTGYRVTIDEDGTWRIFVSGD